LAGPDDALARAAPLSAAGADWPTFLVDADADNLGAIEPAALNHRGTEARRFAENKWNRR
jgi:hypothetical protein